MPLDQTRETEGEDEEDPRLLYRLDARLTDQSTVLRFIEDNWNTGRIGGGSYDALAGTLLNMLDFSGAPAFGERRLLLDPTTGHRLSSGD